MDTLSKVKDYYGRILKNSKDLQTSACCAIESLPNYLAHLIEKIPLEIREKFYGCGSPLPLALEGKTVLDLGCGTGRDCYLLSQLVGADGKVIGVDMTEEQLAVARKYLPEVMSRFGYSKPNIEFLSGYIEDLKSAGIENESVDVVVSNCVTNLSPQKNKVFSEILRVLKPGGELYFSDVFADRRLPAEFREDPVLLGECLGGAMYTEDFRRLLYSLGVLDFRLMNKFPITLENEVIRAKVGNVRFASHTIRAFKLDTLEDRCEDYGQVAYYLGTIAESPLEFRLDDHHLLKAHTPMLVCSNTAAMLSETRFQKHFRIWGDLTHHLGLFDCAPKGDAYPTEAPGACC